MLLIDPDDQCVSSSWANLIDSIRKHGETDITKTGSDSLWRHAYRGRKAIEEATQRLSRAMDKADAELAAAQSSQREARYSHHRSNGRLDDRDAGVHKLGRAAEHDFDRLVTCSSAQG